MPTSPSTPPREQGLILLTLIFMIIVGSLLLAVMAFLYGSASGEQGLQTSGAQAFISAESGAQYGVYWLETNYSVPPFFTTGPAGTVIAPPPADNPDCPAQVTITENACRQYTIQSAVVCASSGARWTVLYSVQAAQGGGGRGGRGGPGRGCGQGRGGGPITYSLQSWTQQ